MHLRAGSSETALHLATLASGGIALAALAWAAHRLFGTWKAATALLAGAAILGLQWLALNRARLREIAAR